MSVLNRDIQDPDPAVADPEREASAAPAKAWITNELPPT